MTREDIVRKSEIRKEAALSRYRKKAIFKVTLAATSIILFALFQYEQTDMVLKFLTILTVFMIPVDLYFIGEYRNGIQRIMKTEDRRTRKLLRTKKLYEELDELLEIVDNTEYAESDISEADLQKLNAPKITYESVSVAEYIEWAKEAKMKAAN